MNSQLLDDSLNTNLIKFNQLLLQGHQYFQLKDMNNAIKSYELALEEPEAQKDSEKLSIIKTNLGIIMFHNCDYKRSMTMLLEALSILDKKNEFKCALIIKILGNMAIIKLIMTEFQECKDYNDQAIQLILGSPSPIKYQLFKELMYIYFRFTSFEAMGDGNFENLEQKYDGTSLACFYSSMGLNRELCFDQQLALKYHKKALQLWIDSNENGFIVITLRRLIQISQSLNIDVKDYVTQLHKFMQSPDLRGISPDVLFKDCDKKLQCARDITNSLRKVEDHLNQQRNQELLSKPLQIQNNDDFWKLAVRIRLKRAIQYCYNLLTQQPQNQEPLHQSITQLQHSLQLLDSPQPYENYLQNLPFTKESTNIVKSQLIKFNRLLIKIQVEPFINYLYSTQQNNYNQYQNQQQQNSPNFQQSKYPEQQFQITKQNNPQFATYDQNQQKQFTSNPQMNTLQTQKNLSNSQRENQQQLNQYSQQQYQQQQKPISQLHMSSSIVRSVQKNAILLNMSYKAVQMGDYLTKCNKNSNGRIDRFFQLGLDNTFRWAAKDKYINDPNKINFYQVSEIRGLVYGKCTEVHRKSYNKDLEPWLCFSLIMKTRSMDFYLKEEQITPWIIALSEEIKRRNIRAVVISPGTFLWRKTKLILAWFMVEKNKQLKKQKKQKFSFAKLICMFSRNNMRFPKI